MNRADAVGYLAGTFGSGSDHLLGQASVGLTDVSGGLKECVDDALLLIGRSYSDLSTAVADSDVPTYRVALRYCALVRILEGLNSKLHMDVKAGDAELRGNQLVTKVERLLAQAANQARSMGLNVSNDGRSTWPSASSMTGLTSLSLGYLAETGG